MAPQRRYHRDAQGEVGYEVAVYDVDVQEVGVGVDGLDFRCEVGKVCSQD